MRQRVITAVIALAIFVPIVVTGGAIFQGAVAILAVIGVYELFKMKGLKLLSFEGIIAALGAMILVLPQEVWLFFLPAKSTSYILYYFCVMILLAVAVFSKNTYSFDEAAFPVLVSLYVGVGFQSFVLARSESLTLIMYALIVVWSTDIGAYMVGRRFGKNKLAPTVSPNKTIEGAIGGILSAVILAAAFLFFYPIKNVFPYSLGVMLALTVAFSIVGQMGDLVESAFKRHFGVKDSGKLLPGHGGILDRFDSMLFVFPVMHLLGLF